MEELIEDEGYNSDELMQKVDKVENKVKFKAFGKTKPRTEKAVEKSAKIPDTEDEQARAILKKQSDKMEEEVFKVKSLKQGRTTNVFKMREAITGKKKAKQEAHAIFDEETKELVVSNSEIKRVTLKYCLNILENNKPDEDFKVLAKLKDEVHQLRMQDHDIEDELEISLEDFFMTLSKFESKKSAA